MAINERPHDWDNEHTLVLMQTGGGKSVYLRKSKLIPAKAVRAVFWDVDRDHDCRHYNNRAKFLKALIAAAKSGRGFRIGWDGADDRKTFEWFLKCVWEILDGTKRTFIVIEEYGDVSESAGEAKGIEKKVWNRSRKYGGMIVAATQRPTAISKTAYTSAYRVVVGIQSRKDYKYIKENAGVEPAQLQQLKKFDRDRKPSPENCCMYWVIEGVGSPELVKIQPF